MADTSRPRVDSEPLSGSRRADGVRAASTEQNARSCLPRFPALFSSGGTELLQRRRSTIWSTTDQRQATSKIAVFKNLRRAIENREIAVVLRSAGEASFAGFSLSSQVAPMICLNKDYGLGSLRSFTLLHELAHITRHDDEFCDRDRFWTETWCNRFASAFLLPANDVREYFSKSALKFATAKDTEPARRVANYFKVSWAAAAVSLERLEIAPQGFASYVVSTRPEPRESGFSASGGLRTHQLRLEEFGRHYTGTMLAAASEDRLHSADLKRRLSVREDQLTSLRSAVIE